MSISAYSAEWYRAQYTNISGSGVIAAAGGDQTLLAGKTGWTTYIQRLFVFVTTSAAQSMSFEDSNGTAKVVAVIPSSPGANSQWTFDFGPQGVPLTEAKDFVLNVSAAGNAAHFEWAGYSRQTGTEYLKATSTGQSFI